MNAHTDHPNLTSLGRFTAWVNAKWQAHRARRLEEETVVCLSEMDARLINDIGMDVDRLCELAPRMAEEKDEDRPIPSPHSRKDTWS
jgi:uncharacterized protein YjiS (DUF1127 family)